MALVIFVQITVILVLIAPYCALKLRNMGQSGSFWGNRIRMPSRLRGESDSGSKSDSRDFFARGQKNRLLDAADRLRKEAEEMASRYPVPMPDRAAGGTETDEAGTGERDATTDAKAQDTESGSVIGKRGVDDDRQELAKKISGVLQRESGRSDDKEDVDMVDVESDSDSRRRAAYGGEIDTMDLQKGVQSVMDPIKREELVDAARKDDQGVRESRGPMSVVTPRTSYAERQQYSVIEKQNSPVSSLPPVPPNVDAVYDSIQPWWLRWIARQASRFFMEEDGPNGRPLSNDEKRLVELAVALEMKDFIDQALDDTRGVSFQQYPADMEGFEDRVRARLADMRAQQQGEGSVGVPFQDLNEQVNNAQAIFSQSSMASDVAWINEEAVKVLAEMLVKGDALKRDAQRLKAKDEDNANFYERVEEFVKDVETFDGNLDRLSTVSEKCEDEEFAARALRLEMERDLEERIMGGDKSQGHDEADAAVETEEMDMFIGAIEEVMGKMEEEGEVRSSSERIVREYFDQQSRTSGAVISKRGAGKVQNTLLRGLFDVSGVNMVQGAVIFEGTLSSSTNVTSFTTDLQGRLAETGLDDEIGIMTIMNEKYPSLDRGIAQAAMESLIGNTPAVIAYPKSWNSTVAAVSNDDGRKLWRSALNAGSILSSGLFAAACLGMLGEQGILAKGLDIPDTFLDLAFAPIAINSVAAFVETAVAKSKGIEVDHVTVPTFSVFNFGGRSIFLNQPQSRTDLFDTAAVGVSTALLLSLVVTFIGLQLTSEAPPAEVVTYPTVSLSLLKTNSLVEQLLDWKFPGLLSSAEATEGQTLHLHWLAISGACSFLANTLQLLPIDNSAGSKMSYAILGQENFTLLSLLFGFFKFLLIVPALFVGFGTGDAIGVMTRYKLLVDYALTSQISGSNNENQLTVDGLNGVTEGRLILYGALTSLVVFALVPFSHLGADFTAWVDSSKEHLQGLMQGQGLQIGSF